MIGRDVVECLSPTFRAFSSFQPGSFYPTHIDLGNLCCSLGFPD